MSEEIRDNIKFKEKKDKKIEEGFELISKLNDVSRDIEIWKQNQVNDEDIENMKRALKTLTELILKQI